VGYKTSGGKALKGRKYPQPDFLRKDGDNYVAVEIKSTQQLNYRKMYDLDEEKHHEIQACVGVIDCRDEALSQIGVDNSTQPDHQLKVKPIRLIPFPTKSGTAIAVLARDGRLDEFKADQRFKAPEACRSASVARDCWTCMEVAGASADVTIVEMKNSPDRLPLAGDGGQDVNAWAQAYFSWSNALWSRNDAAVVTASQGLARLTGKWIDAVAGDSPELREGLFGYWHLYLRGAARERGLEAASQERAMGESFHVSSELDQIERISFENAPRWEPIATERKADQLGPSRSELADGQVERYRMTDPNAEFSAIVDFDNDQCRARLTEARAKFGVLIESDQAQVLADKVAVSALVASGWLESRALSDKNLHVPLRRCTAKVGESTVELGWVGEREWLFELPWRPAWWRYLMYPGYGDPWFLQLDVRVTTTGRATATCSIPKRRLFNP
jgi:hypothetical protein